MKTITTGELVKMLQEADPSGELPVFDWYGQPYCIEVTEFYWDGMQVMILHDEELLGKCYSVKAAKFLGEGKKAVIRSLNLSDVIGNNPDIEVDTSGYDHYVNKDHKRKIEEAVQEYRQYIRNLDERIEREHKEYLETGKNSNCACNNYIKMKYTWLVEDKDICLNCSKHESEHVINREE